MERVYEAGMEISEWQGIRREINKNENIVWKGKGREGCTDARRESVEVSKRNGKKVK